MRMRDGTQLSNAGKDVRCLLARKERCHAMKHESTGLGSTLNKDSIK